MPENDKLPTPAGRDFGVLAYLFVAGFEVALPVLLGVYLDRQFASQPWCTIGGAVVGVIGGTYHLYLVANRQDRPKSGNAE